MRAFLVGLGVSAGLGLAAVLLKDKQRQRKVRSTLDRWSARANNAVGQAASSMRERAAERGATLNTISREELLNVYGIGPVLADRIIANRPYHNEYDVVERGILPESGYKRLQSELRNRRAG